MSSFKITNTIGLIDDDLIIEAEEFRTAPKRAVYIRYTATAAACLCVAGGAAVAVKTRTTPSYALSSGGVDRESSAVQATELDLNSAAPVVIVPNINLSEVYFNEISSQDVGGSRLYFDPEKYDTIVWNKQDITEYFGKELTVKYIPEGLAPSRGNGTASVITEKGGGIVLDHVWLSYYHDFYEDGSPKLTENVAATKGFTVIASKLGMPFQCGILVPSEDMKATDINGTEVLFGHRSMPYGPYDPETHEPSGYYDIYTAEFELDGISYSVTSDQLEAAETVRIVSSIIYGEDVFVGEE